jgi:hypothetical protein
VSIKVLFLLMVLSAAAVIGVAVAAFFRIWWHLKARRTHPQAAAQSIRGEAKDPAERHRHGSSGST